jgi:hypothetical protein
VICFVSYEIKVVTHCILLLTAGVHNLSVLLCSEKGLCSALTLLLGSCAAHNLQASVLCHAVLTVCTLDCEGAPDVMSPCRGQLCVSTVCVLSAGHCSDLLASTTVANGTCDLGYRPLCRALISPTLAHCCAICPNILFQDLLGCFAVRALMAPSRWQRHVHHVWSLRQAVS